MGLQGAVVSDWGALNDKVKSLNAGTDLEMPSSGHLFDKPALAALKTGQLDRARLTRAVANIAAIADRKRPAFTGDRDALLQSHVALAQNIEENSAVLMKNDGTLPLQPGRKLAVIGAWPTRRAFKARVRRTSPRRKAFPSWQGSRRPGMSSPMWLAIRWTARPTRRWSKRP
ncbi:hypothetical protein [Lacticaseibacillus camelliae]|uniref:hypothetical protein n=1 Tax=Lacticaseibacillus camelliae TaxID=381742 RepID=UPI00138F7D2B|nr:hypothetical protein [Lacticaseibacillus camelliae]